MNFLGSQFATVKDPLTNELFKHYRLILLTIYTYWKEFCKGKMTETRSAGC